MLVMCVKLDDLLGRVRARSLLRLFNALFALLGVGLKSCEALGDCGFAAFLGDARRLWRFDSAAVTSGVAGRYDYT